MDGLRAIEPEVYTFMADQAKISLLNTDEGARLQKGLSMIARWIAEGEDTGIRVVSLQRYPCEEQTAESVALAQNGVACAPKRQREQHVSSAVTPASCNDRSKSKSASKVRTYIMQFNVHRVNNTTQKIENTLVDTE